MYCDPSHPTFRAVPAPLRQFPGVAAPANQSSGRCEGCRVRSHPFATARAVLVVCNRSCSMSLFTPQCCSDFKRSQFTGAIHLLLLVNLVRCDARSTPHATSHKAAPGVQRCQRRCVQVVCLPLIPLQKLRLRWRQPCGWSTAACTHCSLCSRNPHLEQGQLWAWLCLCRRWACRYCVPVGTCVCSCDTVV